MPIQWTVDLALGVPELDGQHLQLDAHLRLVHDAACEGRVPDLGAVLDGVRAFAARHFPAEERLMEEVGYDDLARHRAEHRHFTEELARFERLLQSGRDPLLLSSEIGNWLTGWIKAHQRYDTTLRRHLPATPGGPAHGGG